MIFLVMPTGRNESLQNVLQLEFGTCHLGCRRLLGREAKDCLLSSLLLGLPLESGLGRAWGGLVAQGGPRSRCSCSTPVTGACVGTRSTFSSGTVFFLYHHLGQTQAWPLGRVQGFGGASPGGRR